MSEATTIARPETVDTDKISGLVRQILKELGENPDREGLERTPERFAKALRFLTSGYQQDPEKLLNGAMFSVCYDEMVVVRDIELYSLCEHHMLPFFGVVPRGVYSAKEGGRIEQDCAAREYVRAAAADTGTAHQPDRECDSGRAAPGRAWA